jgi:hypothetical protein
MRRAQPSTARFASGVIFGDPLNARDTVAVEYPVAAAISFKVGRIEKAAPVFRE